MRGVKACVVMALVGGMGLWGSAANAGSLGVQASGVRSQGDWGGQIAAGYRFGFAGFDITPGAGLYFHGPTTVFGQVEGGYSIPALARVGIGARFISGDVKAYGTVALPIAPAVHIKGDAGDGYYALGLTLGF
ncbi:MAG TPA: hypothetical protein VFL92_04645 [Sphingomonas sp.]|nr:hypothetical protein [Sphingomonas sp.]